MHYYQFNIADYRKDTVHLSPIEHYIYRSLIDTYYLDEKPICENKASILRKLSLDTVHEQSLTNVLDDFFNLGDCGYEHKRIDEEMDKYQSKAEHSRANGKLGGRPKKPRKTQPVILGNPEEPSNNPAATQTKANHKPLTSNQEPRTINQKEEKHKARVRCIKKQQPRAPSIPYQKIVDLYHELLPELTRCEKLTETRKRYIKSIWLDDMGDLEYWRNFFVFVSKSDFLMGKTNQLGRRPFKANLEWITKPANYLKIYEDQYHG